MRLARAGSPRALIERLFQIDATRAPLHPLLLEFWTQAFGASESSGRGFSVLCGLATIFLIFEIARAAFDTHTGLWAGWLAALSPALIVYSREARMYAWLVLVTCLCWRLLMALSRSRDAGSPTAAVDRGQDAMRWHSWPVLDLAYAAIVTALIYSHPLGLLMAGALALVAPIAFGSWRRWLAAHLVVAAVALPWVGNYLDHPPEFLSEPPTLKMLLGTPIGFVGGNSLLLLVLVGLIAWGIARQAMARDPDGRWRIVPERGTAPLFLFLWLIIPPLALFFYSRVVNPIFGPARYTVFVAPAYLILVALGLTRIPPALRYPLGLILTIVAVLELGPKVYDPELKADWRGFSARLASSRGEPGTTLVIVASSNQGPNVEVETARYYLPEGCEAIALDEATPARLDRMGVRDIYLGVGSRHGLPAVPIPERVDPYDFRPDMSFPGLTIYRAEKPSSLRARSAGKT